jgi:hypothetical protein
LGIFSSTLPARGVHDALAVAVAAIEAFGIRVHYTRPWARQRPVLILHGPMGFGTGMLDADFGA